MLWISIACANCFPSRLSAQDSRVIARLRGHNHWIFSVAFRPDGKRIASSSADRTVKVWDVASRKDVLTMDPHLGTVNGVAYSPDGRSIAAAYADKAMRVCDATNGEPTFTTYVPRYAVSSVAFSPDGKRIATGNFDMTVRVYDVTTGKEILMIGKPSRPGQGVRAVFSPDGTQLARGVDNNICIWNATSGVIVRTLAGHTEPVLCVAFSPDGKRIASGSLDHTVKVWDATNGKELATFNEGSGPIGAVAFSPDALRIASIGGERGKVKVWDSMTGRESMALDGHQGGVNCLAFSPDGKWIATGGIDKTIVIWDITQKTR
jgi:eukaryotic-like serine/threonine-protein kinase